MKSLRQTPVSQMRLTSAAIEAVKKLQVRSALDIAVASRNEVLGLRIRRSSDALRQLDRAVWRIVAHTERQAKSDLRATLKGLRLRMLPARAPDGGQDDRAVESNDGATRGSDTPDDYSVYGRSLTTEEETICSATAVSVLGLSVRACNVAKALGLATALDVARARREELARLKNCGRTTIREFRSAVVSAIESHGHTVIIDVGHAEELTQRVDAILSMLDQRSQFVLKRRFGMWDGNGTTLEGVAAILGVTRERVRQIEARAKKMLRGSLFSKEALGILKQLRDFYLDPNRAPFFGVLTADDIESLIELRSTGKAPELKRAIALRFLVSAFDVGLEHFKQGLATDLEGRFRSEDAANRFKSLETEIRTLLAARGRPIPIDDLANRLCANGLETSALELKRLSQVSSEIGISVGEVALRHWNKFGRGRSAARIERALTELGKPTHCSYVAEKMNFMFPDKAPFQGHAITATMLRYPDVFVSLGRGMYGLRNWGVSRPPYVKDFVIDSMRLAGGQATVEDIAELGARKHGFKKSSIAMTMSLNPNFFQHVRGTLYRLL
jgi:RNA polymerase sigma factor (sigma-70 family)